MHPGGKLPYDRLLRNEGENVLEFAVLFQIGHDQIVHGHHRSILADIIPVGGSAAQDIACIVQLRIAQILCDDQNPASAVLDRGPDLRVAAHVSAAHRANDGKAVRTEMLRAFQLRIVKSKLGFVSLTEKLAALPSSSTTLTVLFLPRRTTARSSSR